MPAKGTAAVFSRKRKESKIVHSEMEKDVRKTIQERKKRDSI